MRLFVLLATFFATALALQPLTAQDTVEVPENFPEIIVEISTNPSPEPLYLANFRRQNADEDTTTGNFAMVVNNSGETLFWYELTPTRAYNFGRMTDGSGNMYMYRMEDFGPGFGASTDGTMLIVNPLGELVQEISVPDGRTNIHEFLTLENGNIILLSQPQIIMDLTAYDGHPEAIVVDTIVKELNPAGEVVWEWQGLDHYTIEDTAAEQYLLEEPPSAVPYIHINGVAVDLDGNYLFSARRFDELIKVNRETGEVMWEMGGGASKHNEFTFIDDPENGFSGLHHINVLPNGNYLLFDNGNRRDNQFTRVVEYEVDEENRTATLVWSYTDGRFGPTLGSVQRLANGNTLIGWGSSPPTGPSVSEVTPDGEVVFALSLPPSQINYRAYRAPFGPGE